MKNAVVFTAAVGVLSASVEAIQLVKRDVPRVVGLHMERKSVMNPVQRDQARRLRKRQSKTVQETLDNFEDGSLYFANITMGSDSQPIRAHIDTGSSDLWVNVANSTFCEEPAEELESTGMMPCADAGTYDPDTSSSYQYVNSDFEIDYADGSGASGDYGSDDIKIGGTTVKALQFGLGFNSSSSEGVLGIGYPSLEAQSVSNGDQAYSNLPQAMVDQGLISSNAYSLWLNDLDSSTGTALFGGVDTEKYHGELQTLPIDQVQGMYLEMIVSLTGVSLTQNGQTKDQATGSSTELPSGVLLDSGSTLSYIPSDIAQNIYNNLPSQYEVQYDQTSQYVTCSCDLMNYNATVDFSFGSATISVQMNELVLIEETQGGQTACIFGLFPQSPSGSGSSGGEPDYTLGDTFIRSAYVVYDIGNNQIALAQTDFNATSSNIMEIGTGADAIPQATGAASAVSQSFSATATGNNGGGVTITSTATGSGATSTSSSSSTAGSSSAASTVSVQPMFTLVMATLFAALGAGFFFLS
ncbi:hypothetical protein MMC25_005272 [Agyrium rufum]|nr:hypothetical protein [Agyrium rufum]